MSPPAASSSAPGPTLLSVKVLPVMVSVSVPATYSAPPLSLAAFDVNVDCSMSTFPVESE